jgi:hypothetical protein
MIQQIIVNKGLYRMNVYRPQFFSSVGFGTFPSPVHFVLITAMAWSLPVHDPVPIMTSAPERLLIGDPPTLTGVWIPDTVPFIQEQS